MREGQARVPRRPRSVPVWQAIFLIRKIRKTENPPASARGFLYYSRAKMAHNEAQLIFTAKPKRSVFSDWLASISKTASMDASFHIVVRGLWYPPMHS